MKSKKVLKHSGRNFRHQLYRIVFIPVVGLIALLVLTHWQNLFLNNSLKEIIKLEDAYDSFRLSDNLSDAKKFESAKEHFSTFFVDDEEWQEKVSNTKNTQALQLLLLDKKSSQKMYVAYVERLGFIIEIFLGLGMTFFVALLVYQQVNKLTFDYRNLLKENQDTMAALEEASRSKDLFLANLSHEFRTPLGAILGFAELLDKERGLTPQGRSHLVFIRRNGKHLLNLMNDLFDLSKVVAHKIDVHKEEIKLEDFILDIEELFSGQIEAKKIDFHVTVSQRIPRLIYTDLTRLKQIVANLIGNAIKFTPENSRIDVVFSYYDNQLHLDVIDQGIGIEPCKQELLFQSFTQLCDNEDKKREGAGLGLALSQKFAHLLGGKVELIFSQKDVGSHFRLSLPHLRRDECKELEASKNGDQNQKDYNFSGKRILLAEDTRENQILFGHYLKLSKAELKIVENGKEAVREALSSEYDLILMDIQMPELNGYEAVKILREANYRRDIVALTAHTFKGEKEKCLLAGFNDYLTKPVSQNTLLNKINGLINVST